MKTKHLGDEMKYTIEEQEEKVILESKSREVWCFYDEILNDWMVTYKDWDQEATIWCPTKTEAITKALEEIGLI